MTGPGDPVLHDDYGAEARYAVQLKAELPVVAFEREIARGLEHRPAGAHSIVDRRIPPFSRGELPHFAGISPSPRHPREVLKFIQLAAAAPLTGIEVIQCSPPCDNADITSLMGTRVICDALDSLVRSGRLPRSDGN